MLHGSESLLLSELETSVLTLAVALFVGTTFRDGGVGLTLMLLPPLGFEPELSDLITISVDGRFLLITLLPLEVVALLLILDLEAELDFLMLEEVGAALLDSGFLSGFLDIVEFSGGSSSSSEESKRLLRDGFEDFFAKDCLDIFELGL